MSLGAVVGLCWSVCVGLFVVVGRCQYQSMLRPVLFQVVISQCCCHPSSLMLDLRNQPYRRTDGSRVSAKWKPGQKLQVSSDISL
ncbi:unnamed protein product [Oncorhynchus mykiss]|uniref:Uncharacterized protein n=1 Tax=Oncorhynchus mykiss TaxID=8022 RepID=A0A060WBE9_ONCMY|nr:unnamed protein product [Oncorhynchus mykiss]